MTPKSFIFAFICAIFVCGNAFENDDTPIMQMVAQPKKDYHPETNDDTQINDQQGELQRRVEDDQFDDDDSNDDDDDDADSEKEERAMANDDIRLFNKIKDDGGDGDDNNERQSRPSSAWKPTKDWPYGYCGINVTDVDNIDCCDGKAYFRVPFMRCCGTKQFNVVTQVCVNSNVVNYEIRNWDERFNKVSICNSVSFNPEKSFCFNNKLYARKDFKLCNGFLLSEYAS